MMKSRFLVALLIFTSIFYSAPPSFGGQTPVYKDTRQPFENRAADLVSRMPLGEKILQMQNGAPAIPRRGVPAYAWWNEALHGVVRAGIATVFPKAIGMAATFND